MIENALFMARADEWFSARHILEIFKDIGRLPTLRIKEIEDGLRRLHSSGRVQRNLGGGLSPKYQLSATSSDELQADFDESSRRFARVLHSLYGGIEHPIDEQSLTPFFLEFSCEVFSALGAQWASYIKGEPLHGLIDLEAVEGIATAKIQKHNIEPKSRDAILRRSIHFLQHSDPDYDYLKFALGQNFYITSLLGVEGKDLLSEEIFSNGKLYLDSSVVIPALLSGSRHHEVFQELNKVCKRLGITVMVTRPTVDEVRVVSAEQARIAPNLYDKVPAKLANRIFGDFFRTYVTMKALRPSTSPEEMFKPFQQLADTLRTSLGIEIVDDTQFEKLPELPDFRGVKDTLQAASKLVRKREKFENALAHDAKVFLFLRSQCHSRDDKVWFVTRDSSLPEAWSRLQPKGMAARCFMLDGLLQSVSPFVTDDGEIKEFSEAFSQVVAAQLLPHGRLFDIEDFLLFQDLDLDCRELSDEEVEDCLLAVKQQVLKGAAYRHDKLEESAYELRRFFARRNERLGAVTQEREKLENKLNKMVSSHIEEVTALRTEIVELQAKEEKRKQRIQNWSLFARKALAVILLLGSFYLVTNAAKTWGEGQNLAQQVISFALFYTLDLVVVFVLLKILVFRKERLVDVFKSWAEVKDLFG